MQLILKNKFVKNMIAAFMAQGISLLQSSFMTFVVAKILDETIFAWWQWFLFLTGLTHYIHLGVGEGILLNYGGKHYSKLNLKKISNEYKGYSFLQFFLCFVICVFGYKKFGFSNEGICIILTGIYLVPYNLSFFLSQLLIASNRTSDYSFSVIANKSLFFITSIVLIILNYRNYVAFAIIYTLGQFLEFTICVYKNKDIVQTSKFNISESIKSLSFDISHGSFLSLSTFLANQITGVGRFLIRIFNGLLDFGALSLSISLCNFFLIFVRQIGMVIFPFLREIDDEKRKNIYNHIFFLIEIVTFGVLAFYFPIRFVLEKWLILYKNSFLYMAYIMPIIVLDSQMSALNTPYLNTMRKEKVLLVINLVALIVTIICSIIAIKIYDCLEFVAMAITVGMLIKDFISYLYICKNYELYNSSTIINLISITVLIVIFVIVARKYNILSMISYIIIYTIFCVINYKKICNSIQFIRQNKI